jgi:hypothetical protein
MTARGPMRAGQAPLAPWEDAGGWFTPTRTTHLPGRYPQRSRPATGENMTPAEAAVNRRETRAG